MEFLRSFLRRHLAGKPLVASPNVNICPIYTNVRQMSAVLSAYDVADFFMTGLSEQIISLLLFCFKIKLKNSFAQFSPK